MMLRISLLALLLTWVLSGCRKGGVSDYGVAIGQCITITKAVQEHKNSHGRPPTAEELKDIVVSYPGGHRNIEGWNFEEGSDGSIAHKKGVKTNSGKYADLTIYKEGVYRTEFYE